MNITDWESLRLALLWEFALTHFDLAEHPHLA